MRIGLISDTHMPGGATEIPSQVATVFKGVDLIFHAGNIYMSSVLDDLEKIAPVRAAGSLDRDKPCHDDPRVEEQQVLEVDGHTVGVIHDLAVPGFGDRVYPGSLTRKSNPAYPGLPFESGKSIVPDEIFGKAVDIVVFGHTCTAMIEEYGELLLINPGSPTLRNELRKIGTVAILELGPGKREVEIIDLAELV